MDFSALVAVIWSWSACLRRSTQRVVDISFMQWDPTTGLATANGAQNSGMDMPRRRTRIRDRMYELLTRHQSTLDHGINVEDLREPHRLAERGW